MGCCGGIDTAKQKKENQRQAGVAIIAATPPNQYTVDLTASDNVNMQRAMEVQMAKYHKRKWNG